ncbi:unnamed protein product [Symbiodinium sp. CCMP2592]|nr:unnamed protein product [Symbiodinium sp. CCMP2592]CAE7660625.1 unnamed protein product [Symbiodinium sp. CCMP2592]
MVKRRRVGVQPARGPKRGTGSRVKIICAFTGCTRTNVCCKNKGITASYAAVDSSKTRKLHATAQLVRFCCPEHRQKCLLKDKQRRGGREALDAQQIVHLFRILAWQRPWAAVLFLLSIMCGERAEATSVACASWLRITESDQRPSLQVPRVNKKTTAHEVPLHLDFAALLRRWILEEPLQGADNQQWPFRGQTINLSTKRRRVSSDVSAFEWQYLFPGKKVGGNSRRNFAKAVTTRAYHYVLVDAQQAIARELACARRQGQLHPFQDVNLQRVTSHSGKKSCATLLSECATATVIGQITATSPRIIEKVYVCPRRDLQREAVQKAFSPVVAGVASQNPTPAAAEGPSTEGLVCCTACGKFQKFLDWKFCPCGTKYVTDF